MENKKLLKVGAISVLLLGAVIATFYIYKSRKNKIERTQKNEISENTLEGGISKKQKETRSIEIKRTSV